jgi:hypothetical protein
MNMAWIKAEDQKDRFLIGSEDLSRECSQELIAAAEKAGGEDEGLL